MQNRLISLIFTVKQNKMKTAEELKKQAHKPGFVNGLYIFTESELESYAEQVAKEAWHEAGELEARGLKWQDFEEYWESVTTKQ